MRKKTVSEQESVFSDKFTKKAVKKVEKYTGFFLRFMRKYNQVWRGFI